MCIGPVLLSLEILSLPDVVDKSYLLQKRDLYEIHREYYFAARMGVMKYLFEC